MKSLPEESLKDMNDKYNEVFKDWTSDNNLTQINAKIRAFEMTLLKMLGTLK